jgi:hypothetical protein
MLRERLVHTGARPSGRADIYNLTACPLARLGEAGLERIAA